MAKPKPKVTKRKRGRPATGNKFPCCVATWVGAAEYSFLKRLAKKKKVSVSVYARAIICDAINEEIDRALNKI